MQIKLVKVTENANLFEAVIPGEGLVRKLLPLKTISPDEAEFNAGIPYGLPFAEIIKPAENLPANLERLLHNAGIWTLDDLRANGRTVVSVMQSVYGIELSSLIREAESYESSKSIPKVRTKKKESA